MERPDLVNRQDHAVDCQVPEIKRKLMLEPLLRIFINIISLELQHLLYSIMTMKGLTLTYMNSQLPCASYNLLNQ